MRKPEFLPEDVVYLKTDPEKLPRIVTAYKVSKDYISYEIACCVTVSYHYGYEITKDKNELEQKSTPGFGK